MGFKFDVEIQQSELSASLNRVVKTASKESKGLEASTSVYVEAVNGKIKFYTQKSGKENTAVSVAKCNVNTEGMFAVSAIKFSGVVSTLSNDKVNLRIMDNDTNKLIVSQGNTKVSLQQYVNFSKAEVCLDIEKIILEPDTSVIQIKASKFIETGNKCNVFIAKNQMGNIYENIFIMVDNGIMKMFATDKRRMQRATTQILNVVGNQKPFAVVPGTFFSELSSWVKGFNEEVIDVIISKNFIILRKDEETFSSVLIDAGDEQSIERYKNIADFPVTQLDTTKEITCSLTSLQKMVTRVNVTIGTNDLSKSMADTSLSVKGNSIELVYQGATDTGKDCINADNPSSVEFVLSYDNSWFASLISNITNDYVNISYSEKDKKVLVIRPKDDMSYIMCFSLYARK